MYNTDPVCSKSPNKHLVQEAIDQAMASAEQAVEVPLLFRNTKNSKNLSD
jgi:pyrroloquinoline quinone biosynthesis protein E